MAKRTNKSLEKSHAQVLWLAIVSIALGLTFLRSSVPLNADRGPASLHPASIRGKALADGNTADLAPQD